MFFMYPLEVFEVQIKIAVNKQLQNIIDIENDEKHFRRNVFGSN